MSKTSPKQRHTQLLSWLSTFKKSTSGRPKRESRMDYNKKQGGRQKTRCHPGFYITWLRLFLVFSYNVNEVGENGETQVYIRVQTS